MRRLALFVGLAMVLASGIAPDAGADSSGAGFLGWLSPKPAETVYRGKEIVSYPTREAPGTVIVDSPHHRLYLILKGGKAIRYAVGVGREGFGWKGTAHIGRRAMWPAWYPPPEMVARAAQQSQFLPYSIDGGPNNPLGARALYLYQDGHDTMVRIHGTNEPRSVGKSVSSGCIRMLNEEVIDLYNHVGIGTKVIVLG